MYMYMYKYVHVIIYMYMYTGTIMSCIDYMYISTCVIHTYIEILI